MGDPQSKQALDAFAASAAAQAPTIPNAAFISWFEGHQTAHVALVRRLTAAWRQRRRAERVAPEAARAAADAADTAVEAAAAGVGAGAGLAAAIAGATQARHRLRQATTAYVSPIVHRAQQKWLHTGERACPLLTALIHPPRSSSTVPVLRTPGGRLLTKNRDIAQCFAEHYAAIAAAPLMDPAARLAVLGAISAAVQAGTQRPIPQDLSAWAGAADISSEETSAVFPSCRASSAAGPDGAPYSMWTDVAGGAWAPVLARLFTVIGTSGVLPRGFNLGSITPLPKPDAPSYLHAIAFRPITLLPTVYRILSKVLARRYAVALSPCIDSEQSAYLPHRLIEDSVMFEHLLPQAMAAERKYAAGFSLDIAKAFDTVDRSFLFDAMAALGASPGMVNWARLLLHDTRASVHINGVESRPVLWHTGVRQGCPLSPLLYLVIPQALTVWLRSFPYIGVTIGGVRHVACFFADDAFIPQEDLRHH